MNKFSSTRLFAFILSLLAGCWGFQTSMAQPDTFGNFAIFITAVLSAYIGGNTYSKVKNKE